ncbi:MAG: tRNA 4-thiouridine(8) synthase ThiI [Deltaproteobacteria bacterium]|nr:tRNA 4-thiouridine(8) synthase ThiI [Deltaproteobacteria bacterium]
MNNHENKVRALGLCSGGLDSILSAVVLRNQGISVEWISFETPFFSSEKARRASARLRIPLIVQNITRSYLEMLRDPPCGYGQHMNPCMDCHALMFRLAGEVMKGRQMDFLFSGEVLGQRPMSQTRSSLRYVEKHSGCREVIVRPLSAKLLEESLSEKKGLVDRRLLLGLSGRSRKPQIQLAREWGISDYPAPAGGCLLTETVYSNRLKDLFDHGADCTENALHLLKYGRHIRLNTRLKIIVGRTLQDNTAILDYQDPSRDMVLKTKQVPGPVVLIPLGAGNDEILQAASICAGYSKASENMQVAVEVVSPGDQATLWVARTRPESLQSMLIC